MPPPRHREHDFHRKSNRSMSPPPHKKKRSWLSSSSSHDRSHQRSPSPRKKEFKPMSKPHQSTVNYYRNSRSRSRSPKYGKRSTGNNEGYSRYSSKDNFKSRSPGRREKTEFGSRQESRSRKRSLSPVSSLKDHYDSYRERERGPVDHKLKNVARSPDSSKSHGLSSKRKYQSSPPVHKKVFKGRSPSPVSPPSSLNKKQVSSQRTSERETSIPQRKVSSTLNKKKTSRTTLHNRFTTDDTEPFQLQMKDNVTIAILRNPRAEPSDDVTVQRIFDSSLFKMVHKKTEGRKPIFDREEIKVWRHDENLEEDPDFEERRLVRVKTVPKKAADSSLRMSPDVLRKSLGMERIHDGSGSQSPHRSPNVRINPQPDSRYESRYQQQIKREESESNRKRKEEGRRGRGGREDESDRGRFQSKGEDVVSSRGPTRGDDYDLRHALERRRSGKDEDFDRGSKEILDRHVRQNHDDRNVVMDQDRRHRFDNDGDRERGRGWDIERRGWGRGRGRGPRRQWSPKRNTQNDRDGYNSRDRGFHRRERFSISPVTTRGRGSGFRGRGRGRDLSHYEDDRNSPPGDDYYKYAQHDDRDISPKSIRGGRGRGNRFQSNRGFRGGIRGRFFGGNRGRGFGSRGRGRGFFGRGNSRSIERDDRRSVEHGSEREWKHDMYDTVQSDEDELPHSTTVIN